ncbi:thiamine phosphate synthase [Aestuariibius insulae]|uniref:thiamine phosphate synthase n=1 Tax=Aestuariibius insulae TaxID=2058287 RepID=UPI00345E9006
MPDPVQQPQLYLITPPVLELSRFLKDLKACLDEIPVACMRLSLATEDEDRISRTADALREELHTRDIALVLDRHVVLAERLGLDGVHLTDGARSVIAVRKTLHADAIVGAYCHASSHDGMSAGERGADYISFGPVGDAPLGDGIQAEDDLFQWWSQMIELPVVAEGGLTEDHIARLSPFVDFFALGPEVWEQDDPLAALRTLHKAIG